MLPWKDPIGNLPACRPYPFPASVASTDLSSALTDPDSWFEHKAGALSILQLYSAQNEEDDTVKILKAFLAKLPKRGQLALAGDIYLGQDQPAKLRHLRNFLVDSILKPSTSIAISVLFEYI